MKRAEAGEEAWRKMAEAYPPLVPEQSGDAAIEETTQRICTASSGKVGLWQQKYGVTLPDDARDTLAGEVVAYCWVLGLMGNVPE